MNRGDGVHQLQKNGSGGRVVSFFLLSVVLLLALFLRVAAVLQTEVVAPMRSDAGHYYAYAYNLHQYGVYSRDLTFRTPTSVPVPHADTVRTPGYPFFLYPFAEGVPTLKILTNITLMQALLSTVTVLLAYLLFRYVLPVGWSIAGALLTAISPHLVNANVYILTESIFTLILVAVMLTLFYAVRGRRISVFLLAGLLLGLGTLVRPGLQYLAFVVAIYLAIVYSGGLRWKVAVALVLGFSIVVAPWYVRNKISTGEFSSDYIKIAFLHHGMYPEFKYKGDDRTLGFPYRYDPESPRIRASMSNVVAEIVRRFREHPLRQAHWYLVGKPVTLWSWHIVQGMGDSFVYEVRTSPYFVNRIFQVSHWVSRKSHDVLLMICLFTMLYVWTGRARREQRSEETLYLRLVTLVLAYFTVLHMIGTPFPRYSIPLRPFMYGVAMYGLWRFADEVLAHFREQADSTHKQ
jgi:4-amino-4-deoxy-L-arabinose transferase-like glycosyltransferase